MKVRFDLSEENKLKAYYLLQLQEKAGIDFNDSFNQFLNNFASGQFSIGLDLEIQKFESRLFGERK